MDIWDYFEQRRRKCEECSLVPIGDWEDMFNEHEGSAGKVGLMLGRFMLRDGAYLKVTERVVAGESGADIHRVSYAYFLTVDEREIWGRERDPTHEPAEHGHGLDHERVATGRITLQDAIKEAWEALHEYDAAHPAPTRRRSRRRRRH